MNKWFGGWHRMTPEERGDTIVIILYGTVMFAVGVFITWCLL